MKKYSGSSTNAGTDIANDSVCIQRGGVTTKSESENNDPNYFTSSHNNELVGSINGFKNSSNDVSRDEQ